MFLFILEDISIDRNKDNSIERRYLEHTNINDFTQALFETKQIHGNTTTHVDPDFHNIKIPSPISDLLDLCFTNHLGTSIELSWALKTTLNTKSIRTKTFLLNTERNNCSYNTLKPDLPS